MTLRQRWLYFGILSIVLIAAFIPFETTAGTHLVQMLKVTLTVYAVARGLNAAISVAQGTEVSIEPLGVGLTLTPGEVLDPLNDLIEQFSLVLLMASASLGVQKILLTLGDIEIFRWCLAALAVVAMIVLWVKAINTKWQKRLLSWIVVLSLLRLAVPMTTLVSYQAQQWLQADRVIALTELEATRQEVAAVAEQVPAEDKRWLQGLRENLDLRDKLAGIEARAERGVEAAVYLLAEFFLIMMVIPLVFLFISIKIMGRILRFNR